MSIYVEEHSGYTANVCERDGKWWVNLDVVKDGGTLRKVVRLIEETAEFEGKSFGSFREAEAAAHQQFQHILDKTFDAEWKEKC